MHKIVRVALSRKGNREFTGRIIETFESLNDPEVELAIVQEARGFPSDFSDAAIQVAKSSQRQLGDSSRRVDLTKTNHVTIDGETARDFDDAICVTQVSKNIFNLKVSIADVSHFVPENSALDREAFERGTSIYFPDRAIPMLPEILSNNLCSLVPKEERYTLTCDMDINRQGEIVRSSIYPSKILSQARLTYTIAAQVVEKGQRGLVRTDLEEMLVLAHELALIVRNRRREKGGLDLDLPETEMEIDRTGNVLRTYISERNEAHKLIEDFMILANECVSESIEKAGYSSVFRIHEDPDPLKIERLQKIVKRWGFSLSMSRDLEDSIQRFLDSIREHRDTKILAVSLLRSLKQARYSATNAGHFGLGSESYTHFTSPIRRYPDLMVHRILRNSNFLKAKAEPYAFDKLEQMSNACSDTERRAFFAERDMEDLKKVRYMEGFVGETFDGLVVSVKNFGLFVEILPHGVEGLIPFRNLPPDHWNVDELETVLKGSRTHKEYWLGDRLKVKVARVDRFKRQIDLQPIIENPKGQRKKGSNVRWV